jgi:hypothetical protein
MFSLLIPFLSPSLSLSLLSFCTNLFAFYFYSIQTIVAEVIKTANSAQAAAMGPMAG